MDLLTLNQFPAVAASSLVTLVTDELRGMSVHGLVFEQGGTTFTKAQMTNIKVSVGGKSLVDDISGDQLQDLNDYAGLGATSDYVFLWFGDPTARTIRGQHLGDLDLSIYNAPLNIEVTIGAATAPTLQVHAMVGPPKRKMGIGYGDVDAVITRALIRSVLQPAAAVTKKAYGIGLGSEAGARLRSIGFFHTNLTSVEFKKGGFIKHQDASIALNSAIQAEYARVPQSGLYMLDRIVDANQGEAETTLQADGRPWPFQVLVTTSSSDTIDAFADVHAALAML